MTEDDKMMYDWTTTFESLKYQAKKRGKGETEFASCLKCIEAELEDYFDKASMVLQGKIMGVEVIFVPCKKHDGVTV